MTKTTKTGSRHRRRAKTPPARVLVADPPWKHRDKLGKRGAAANYQTMSTEEICQLDLPPLAREHVLLLWRLGNMQQDALNVCRAWQFQDVAEVIWEKLRPCQTCAATGRVDVVRIDELPEVIVPGSDNRCPACRGARGVRIVDDELGELPAHIGMGTTVRNVHEVAIIARPIGGRAPERLHADVRSSFAAPMLIDIDGDLPESGGRKGALVHSAKPSEFYALVERLYPGPYVEMFGRRSRENWQVLGDQDSKLDLVVEKFAVTWPRRVREERLAALRAKVDRKRG